jgi:hypothetical protein
MIALALLPFEVDPNVVKPGWTPLIILVLLALAMAGLFISMRRQFRKIDVNRAAGGFGGPVEDVQPDGPSIARPADRHGDVKPGTRPTTGPTP